MNAILNNAEVSQKPIRKAIKIIGSKIVEKVTPHCFKFDEIKKIIKIKTNYYLQL